jgi:protein-tyrosine-phosphatase
MVCTGNICRSPAMHYLAGREWGDAAEVTSAGTYAEIGYDATPEIRRSAATRGVHIPRHRPSQLSAARIAQAHLVLVATENHERWVTHEMRGAQPHVFGLKQAATLAASATPPAGDTAAERLMNAAGALRAEQERNPVPLVTLDDPWAHSQEVYDRVFGEIADAIDAITRWAGLGER